MGGLRGKVGAGGSWDRLDFMRENGAKQNGMLGLREKRSSRAWHWDKDAVMSRAGTSYEAPREVGGALRESEVPLSHASGRAGNHFLEWPHGHPWPTASMG